MPKDTYTRLESLCAGKGIVCERIGKRIVLTTPDGSVMVNCENLAEAFDTVRNDPTFSKLPIKLAKPAPAEIYEYEFRDTKTIRAVIKAETLNQACDAKRQSKPFRTVYQFAYMAVVEYSDGETWGVTWN